MGLVLPSLWRACFGLYNEGIGHISTAFSFAIAAFLYTSQIMFLFFMTASSFVFPPKSSAEIFFREKPQIPLLFSAVLLYFSIGKRLFMKPNLVRKKSKFNNAKVLSVKVIILIFIIGMVTIIPAILYTVLKFETVEPPAKDSKFFIK